MADAAPKPEKAPRRKRVSRSMRAGLTLPVGRVTAAMRAAKLGERLSGGASVYVTAIMESMMQDVLKLAIAETTRARRKMITPRFIQLAVRNDDELREFLEKVAIGEGGVVPTSKGRTRVASKNKKKPEEAE